jgi:hypothetical protein
VEALLIIPPNSEPITVAEAKEYLRVTHSFEDGLIRSQITSARGLCEFAGRVSMITQTRSVSYKLPAPRLLSTDFHPGLYDPTQDVERTMDGCTLLRGPVASIESVQVFNGGEDKVTVDPSLYYVTGNRLLWRKGFAEFAFGKYTDVVATYVAGFPLMDFRARYPDIIEAVKITVANLYESRGLSDSNLPPQAAQIMRRYWRPIL